MLLQLFSVLHFVSQIVDNGSSYIDGDIQFYHMYCNMYLL